MAMAIVAACVDPPLGPCGDHGRVEPVAPAYRGFQWACHNAPTCAVQLACDDPGWRRLGAARLDEAAACLLGPCELRRECLDHVLATCRTQ